MPAVGEGHELGDRLGMPVLLERGEGDGLGDGVVLAAGHQQHRAAPGVRGVDLRRRVRVEVRRGGLEQRLARRRDGPPREQRVGLLLGHGVAEREAELLGGQGHRAVLVRRVPEHRQRRSQRGQRQRQDPLDLGGVDRHGGRGQVLAEQLLGDHAAEGVADQDRQRVHASDDRRVVLDDVVDAVVGDALRVLPRVLDAVGVAGPARRGRVVALLAEEVDPRLPGGAVQPQAVDEEDGDRAGHRRGAFLGIGYAEQHTIGNRPLEPWKDPSPESPHPGIGKPFPGVVARGKLARCAGV
ncbi:hypothetical protein SCOCK_60135 [Actinacidiphila cocklensis]|uniref:Uncharacterized protein n=1 Tax=Actinacidiphila cocklensis TaxID=887465 RepID=A0A9W4DXH6_9ACTN|nr:hypothetical protein SCOCK_60135 [Actinacidiphila cocklensis]